MEIFINGQEMDKFIDTMNISLWLISFTIFRCDFVTHVLAYERTRFTQHKGCSNSACILGTTVPRQTTIGATSTTWVKHVICYDVVQ